MDNKDESKKRLFIAIDIPEAVKNNIFNFAADLLRKDRYVKLVPVSNIHITLKFLGNVDTGKIGKIEKALKVSADVFEKFKYNIRGEINAFPDPGNARVIFLEIDRGGDRISEIYNRLENNLSRIKIKREKRKFSPHITIARIRSKKNMQKITGSHKVNFDAIMDCSEITLFESKLKPEGAEYIILNNFGLK